MDKNQVIEILNSKGLNAHDTNGILYIDLEDISPASVNKTRELLAHYKYFNSWGVKKIQTGVLTATNKTVDLTDGFNYSVQDSHDIEKESDNPAQEAALSPGKLAYSDNDSENTDNTSPNSEDDDMMFDENSSYEQVSLFDMMT